MAADQGGFEDRCGEAVLAFLEDEAEFAGDGAAAKLLQGLPSMHTSPLLG